MSYVYSNYTYFVTSVHSVQCTLYSVQYSLWKELFFIARNFAWANNIYGYKKRMKKFKKS